MISFVHALGIHGMQGFLTRVETFVSRGIPEFDMIGLGDTSVKEAKRRVIAALKNQGYEVPSGRITVNLAPSCIKKEGTGFDLAIAAGLLCAGGVLDQQKLNAYGLIGELSLDGTVRQTNGVIAMLIAGRNQGIKKFIVPFDNASEGSRLADLEIFGIRTLCEISEILKGAVKPHKPSESVSPVKGDGLCFSDVKGQETAKRALEIAAAGGHNILLLGAAGSGKTMLAKRVKTILPPLTEEEALEVLSIYSICGNFSDREAFSVQRPFREIHTGISKAGLTGSGRERALPGEITLAHRGVLFLDEMTEMPSDVLDTLRQPLESGTVLLNRAGFRECLPADFMLVGAANPCRCGRLLEGNGTCFCTPYQVQRHLSRISKPLLDRIDLQVAVRSLTPAEMQSEYRGAETSAIIRERVLRARAVQKERYKTEPVRLNARLSRNMLDRYCTLSVPCKKLLATALSHYGLTMRAYEKILRVSRTIADLDGRDTLQPGDIAEAIQYRSLDHLLFDGRKEA